MNLIDYSSSSLSIVAPLIALILAMLTRRVILSLGIGIIVGAVLLNDFNMLASSQYVVDRFFSSVVKDGQLNDWNMSVIVFLILLGMMTAILTLSGGTRAFAQWATTKIKTPRGAKLLSFFLGIFIFIDDYFNSLAVGTISRPVTDKYKVSRAKLAYILDSTAAPTCVLMPVSSWGAYIMTVIIGILTAHGITQYSALEAYIQLLPMNFYAIFALVMVFVVIWFDLDIGAMKKQQELAYAAKPAEKKDQDNLLNEELGIIESAQGKVSYLVVPILLLTMATVCALFYTGAQALEAQGLPVTVFAALENTNVGYSLVVGGLLGLMAALGTLFLQPMRFKSVVTTLLIGARSMISPIVILFFAWAIGSVIGDTKTGIYLSSLIEGNISPVWLPALLFLLSGLMAFATGTSWGTFGIMLPIAGDMSMAADPSMLFQLLGAVLAGAVFGDHCSPISDTTILSSAGARCDHIVHVSTQLPYAMAVASVSLIGFIVIGLTGSLALSLSVASLAFLLVVLALKWVSKKNTNAYRSSLTY